MAVDLIFFASRDNPEVIMCHGNKLASVNWCC